MLDNNTMVAEWYDIYGARHLPFWKHPYSVWGVRVAILGVMCTVLIVLWYKYRRSPRYVSPRAKALRGLHEIRTQYLHKHHTRIFYVTLTRIAKQYISETYGLDVCAKTDTEMLTILRSKECSINGARSLEPIFEHVEHIKFASGTVGPEKMSQDADLLDCFIDLHHTNNQTHQNNT